jgi:class 3 adenylate cyclase
MTAAAPSGVVTFLFTDVEGSTRRWESDAESMRSALIAHDEVLRTAIEAHDGFLFSHTGDGVVAAFMSPPVSATTAAELATARLESVLRLIGRPWPSCMPVFTCPSADKRPATTRCSMN